MLLRWEVNGDGQAFLRLLPAAIPIPTPQGVGFEDPFFGPTTDEECACDAPRCVQDPSQRSPRTTVWWAAAIGSTFGQPGISTDNLHTLTPSMRQVARAAQFQVFGDQEKVPDTSA